MEIKADLQVPPADTQKTREHDKGESMDMTDQRREKTFTKVQRQVIRRIQRLFESGEALNIAAVKREHPKLIETVYSVKPFWGWKRALEAAGIKYSDIRIELSDSVVCKICGNEYGVLMKHLKMRHGINAGDYVDDYPGSEYVSDTWRAAHRKMKHNAPMRHWEPVWSKEYVLDRISELHSRGLTVNQFQIQKTEAVLCGAGAYYFGTWNNALRKAGIDLDAVARRSNMERRFYPTPETVTDAIRKRLRKGVGVNRFAVEKGPAHDYALVRSAKLFFGSWPKALGVSGFDVRKMAVDMRVKRRRYRDRQAVLAGMMRREKNGWPLNHVAVVKGPKRDFKLYLGAVREFGSWKKAMEEAGLAEKHWRGFPYIDYDKIRFHIPRYKNRADVLKEIRRRYKLGLPLTSNGVRKGPDRNSELYRRAHRCFRGWTTAVTAAGIDYNSLHLSRKKYSSKQAVLDGIRHRHQAGWEMSYRGIRKGLHRDSALYDAALALFGNWAESVERAGLDIRGLRKPGGKYQTARAVVAEIRHRYHAGLTLSSYKICHCEPKDRPLINGAVRLLGRWSVAIEKAGLKRRRHRTTLRRKGLGADQRAGQIGAALCLEDSRNSVSLP